MTTETVDEPQVGDVVAVTDDTGVERVGRIVVHADDDLSENCWLVAFPPDAENWMGDSVQRVWFPAGSLRLIDGTSAHHEIGDRPVDVAVE